MDVPQRLQVLGIRIDEAGKLLDNAEERLRKIRIEGDSGDRSQGAAEQNDCGVLRKMLSQRLADLRVAHEWVERHGNICAGSTEQNPHNINEERLQAAPEATLCMSCNGKSKEVLVTTQKPKGRRR